MSMRKRILSALFLLSFSLTGIQEVLHAFGGHYDVVCKADRTDHVHRAEFDCAFHQIHFTYTLDAGVAVPDSPEMPIAVTLSAGATATLAKQPIRTTGLRAPPV